MSDLTKKSENEGNNFFNTILKYNKTFFLYELQNASKSSKEVIPAILDLFKPHSVVDVGCGEGSWLAAFQKKGVTDILGIDDGWVDLNLLQIPKDKLMIHDLTKPLVLKRKFDLVISLEVGEHLKPNSSEMFVRTLTSLGDVVIFSAAIPYQGGVRHVNEKWPEFWQMLFKRYGYVVIDCIRPKIWNNNSVSWFYKQNMLLYVRKNKLGKYPKLEELYKNQNLYTLTMIHPQKYISVADPKMMDIRQVVAGFPWALVNLVRFFVHRNRKTKEHDATVSYAAQMHTKK